MAEIITLPSFVGFEDAQITLRRGSVVLRSKYTGKRQVLVLPYALWIFSGRLVPVDGTDAADWRGFLVDLDGQANKFRLPVPGVVKPSSNYSGTQGCVNGVGQSGRTLLVDGLTINALYLRRGDYFTVNDELKIVTETVSASATGTATLTFKPRLRASPPDNALIIVNNPTMMVSSDSDDAASWALTRPVQHGISISAIEAID